MAGLDGISTLATALGSLNGSVNAAGSASATAEAKQQTEPAKPVTAKDQANVSSAGGLVAQALSTSDVRLDKVSALQSAIASGSYNIPASDVANKIVDNLLK